MKKLMALVLASMVLLTACTTGGKEVSNPGEVYKIGISQLAEHPALDDVKRGFEHRLEELGVNVEIDYKNAQGDIPTTMTIAQKFVSDKVDLIFAIATPAAQSAKQASQQIPVLFSAVTDPVQAGIVDDWENVGGNVTGTSDLADSSSQLKMFHTIDPNIKKVGILYNTSEPNSEIQIEEIKRLAPAEGLEIVTGGISNLNELAQALDSILKKVDALYTITDNSVASSMELVSKKLLDNNMVSVSAYETAVIDGILVTDGLSYYELGKQTAEIAKKILVDKIDVSTIPVGMAEKTFTTVNINTLEALGLNPNLPLFKNATKIGE